MQILLREGPSKNLFRNTVLGCGGGAKAHRKIMILLPVVDHRKCFFFLTVKRTPWLINPTNLQSHEVRDWPPSPNARAASGSVMLSYFQKIYSRKLEVFPLMLRIVCDASVPTPYGSWVTALGWNQAKGETPSLGLIEFNSWAAAFCGMVRHS